MFKVYDEGFFLIKKERIDSYKQQLLESFKTH